MNKIYIIILLSLISACTSSPIKEHQEALAESQKKIVEQKTEKISEQIQLMPDWYLDVPKPDETGIYGVGAAESDNIFYSLKSAELDAKGDLSKQFKQFLSGQERRYESQSLHGNVSTQTEFLIDNLIEEVNLAGVQRVKREVVNNNGVGTAFVLLKMPYEHYNLALKNLKQQAFSEQVKESFEALELRLEKRKKDVAESVRQERLHQLELGKLEVDMERARNPEQYPH